MIACVQQPDGSYCVQSQTNPGMDYRVTLTPDGCECKAFTYRRKCAHVLAARAEQEAARICGEVFDAAGFPPVAARPVPDATLDALLGTL